MATAPKPRATGEMGASRRVFVIRVRDEERRLAAGNLPFKERMLVRKATGLPIESFLGENVFGEDSLMVLWWLAGRAQGEAFLTLDQVAADWPTDLTENDIDLAVEDPTESDDPES